MIHINITLTGNVQHIGFRFFSLQHAVKLGINGFVMNVDDDKIYIEAEGPADKIEEYKNWLRSGQCSYSITQISIELEKWRNLSSFDIIYEQELSPYGVY
ncbi:MAG: acylphosphatase [Bacteroidota bacterium]|jgi:acylphosphatase